MSDYIGIDVLSLILKWLPVKTLFRFKSVCKSWKQLTESDSFAIEHLSAQTQNPLVIVRNQTWNDLKLIDPRSLPAASTGTITHHPNDFPVDGDVNRYDALHTLHGLICLYNRTTSHILVWNPSIRRFLTVPPRAPGSPHKLCGFWFDPCKNRFKVLICVLSPVQTAMVQEAMAQEFAVYSSGDQAWNQVPRADNLGAIIMTTYSVSDVFIDGVAHWIALSHSGEYVVMSFKLSSDNRREELEIIKLPEALQPRRCDVSLCKWQGSRSVVRCQVVFPQTSCSIWAMIDGAWSMMLSFDVRGTVYHVFCVLHDSGKVLANAWNGAASELVLCDPHSGEHIRHLTPSVLCKPTASVASDFVESLVFPDPYGISSGY